MAQDKSKRKIGGKREGAGKPKTKLTEEQWSQIGMYAFNGNQNGTIAELMDWDRQFIDGRPDILSFLRKKRAERKNWLLSQNKRFIESNLGCAGSVLMFTEKQTEHLGGLGFSDHPEQTNNLTDATLSELIKQIKPSKGVLPRDE